MIKITNIGKAVGYITGGSIVFVITEALIHLSPLYIFLTVVAYLLTIIVVTFMLIRFERESETDKIKAKVLAEEDERMLEILNSNCLNAKGTEKDLCEKLNEYLEARISAFSILEK
ncbi:hypothetical protein [Acidianus ambivalens]|uniref:Uncharacterized protein n=1 Tax=Acidianus ambivalens TaxID=2283 RepID=A0A650CTC7_ACIAM|nr:hypothetical protein [Acidianus ambivalens]MQL56490.1 hypothetical protein [Acidianus ambivalens]QGR21121.1 hypothetical protein D1866_03160 [Acidianus ambivalens]